MSEEEDQTMEKAASDQNTYSTDNPSWHLPTLADIEDRMKHLVINSTNEEENAGDTFAERAEWYYRRRPQLLSLLKDLYNGYVTLLDRCQNANRKHHFPTNVSEMALDHHREEEECSQIESDIESTMSYQQPPPAADIDEMIGEGVSTSVEKEMLVKQVRDVDHEVCNGKMELLKKLIDLLEMERVILMNENAKLGYKVTSLLEENKGLASEAIYVKRKAGDLARLVLRMREDHRVCILTQKIEDLQEQIYGLEKRNKDYYQMLVKTRSFDYERRSSSSSSSFKDKTLEVFQWEKVGNKLKKAKSAFGGSTSSNGSDCMKKKGSSKWWEKVKNVELFSCGPQPSCT